MQGVYQAKYSFNKTLREFVLNDGDESINSIKSMPASPKASRYTNNNDIYISSSTKCVSNVAGDTILKKSPTSCVKLEKCSSEPNVFDNNSENDGEDSVPVTLPNLGYKSENYLAVFPSSKRNKMLENEFIIGFEEGDLFQVLSKEEHAYWWAVRAVKDQSIGYVPANYLTELEDNFENVQEENQQEINERALAELRQRVEHLHLGTLFPVGMIPEPELCPAGEELEKRNRRNTTCPGPVPPSLPMLNQEGLILPRKPLNPCLESTDHKNLHRELLFNQKIGKNVLNQKSELQKALEKHKEHQVKKELQQQRDSSKTAFEKVIEERARRLESMDKPEEVQQKCVSGTPEFLQVHAKLRARMDSK